MHYSEFRHSRHWCQESPHFSNVKPLFFPRELTFQQSHQTGYLSLFLGMDKGKWECNWTPTVNNRCPIQTPCWNLSANTCVSLILGPITTSAVTHYRPRREHISKRKTSVFLQTKTTLANPMENCFLAHKSSVFNSFQETFRIFKNWFLSGHKLLF
jgi:hypothetical protein